MKRKFGFVAVAALSTIAFSQLALADNPVQVGSGAVWEDYNEVTAVAPKRADEVTAPRQQARIVTDDAYVEYNEVTAVAPKRADEVTAPRQQSKIVTDDAYVEYNEVTAVAPKRAGG